MSSVHERNFSNGKRALEDLRANMASGMSPEEVLLRLGKDFDALDWHAYASYTTETEPENNHPEVEVEEYVNVMLKMSILRGYLRGYLDGKTTPAETLAAISRRFKIPSAYQESPDPGPTASKRESNHNSAPDAPTAPPIAVQRQVLERLESFREDITSLRERVDRAVSGGAYVDTADPIGAMVGLMFLQKDCAALLARLDRMFNFIPSLSVTQAFEEEIRFQGEILRVAKKVKELDPAVWRTRHVPRPSPADYQKPTSGPVPHQRPYNPYRPAAWQDVSDRKILLWILFLVALPFVFFGCLVAGGAG